MNRWSKNVVNYSVFSIRRFRVTSDSGERNLSLEERRGDLGAGPEGVWRRGRAGGQERSQASRWSGAEARVGSGGREQRSGAEVGSRRSGADVTRVVTKELTRERSRDHAGDYA